MLQAPRLARATRCRRPVDGAKLGLEGGESPRDLAQLGFDSLRIVVRVVLADQVLQPRLVLCDQREEFGAAGGQVWRIVRRSGAKGVGTARSSASSSAGWGEWIVCGRVLTGGCIKGGVGGDLGLWHAGLDPQHGSPA